MKKFGIWAVAAALFFAPMGLSSCSMGSSASEMKGSLNFTQDDLTEKPFKAIDVDVIASVYYTQNNGDECSVRLDYSAIKDAEFVQKLKEKLKVVYRDGEVKIGLNGKLKVPAVCNSEKNRLRIHRHGLVDYCRRRLLHYGRRILQYQQEEIHAFRVPFLRFSW